MREAFSQHIAEVTGYARTALESSAEHFDGILFRFRWLTIWEVNRQCVPADS